MPSAHKRKKRHTAVLAAPEAGQAEAEQLVPLGTLFQFRHGLGDLVQFSIVLRHLAAELPGQVWDVVCAAGKELSRTRYERDRFSFQDERNRNERYQQVVSIDWGDCRVDPIGFPATKVYECLTSVLRLTPRQELFRYELEVRDEAIERAANYLYSLCGRGPGPSGRFPVVLLHYQGNSSTMQKDLANEIARAFGEWCRTQGRSVAILPSGKTCPWVDQKEFFSPLIGHPVWGDRVNGDPETVAALIRLAELHVGIDSGPTHVAAATDTPTIAVWSHHHPIRFFDFCPNVVHLVPINHARQIPGPNAAATFTERYRHSVYSNQLPAMIEQAALILGGPVEIAEPTSKAIGGLHATGYTEQYYVEHLLGGLDYLGHGEWQRTYGLWLADVLGWRGQRVLDVGCACGSVMRGMGEAGMIVEGVDCSEYLVSLGREKWPDMDSLLHVGDAVNLHFFPDQSWDGLHSNQVAEHWKPALVPFILQELRRIIRPEGLFFCVLDTTELFARANRTMDKEDPTHICVKPLDWWHEQARVTGWDVVTVPWDDRLRKHPHSYFKLYDWDYFILQRPKDQE